MLSLWPLEQFIFEIRVLQNKTIEFARTSLSYRPIAALSTELTVTPGKLLFLHKFAPNYLHFWVSGPML